MGTAPSKKTEKGQKWLENYVSLTFLYKYFYFIWARASPCPTIRSKEIQVRMNFFEIHNKHFVPLSFSPPNF